MNTIKDRTRVTYITFSVRTGFSENEGVVVESYQRKNGMWVIVHDKARNKSVTIRLSQITKQH